MVRESTLGFDGTVLQWHRQARAYEIVHCVPLGDPRDSFISITTASTKNDAEPPCLPPAQLDSEKAKIKCSEYSRGKISKQLLKFWLMTDLLVSRVYAVENPPSTKLAVMTSPRQRIVSMNTRDRIARAFLDEAGRVWGFAL